MATTQTTYTGNGSTTNYSFTFEYIKQADVKVTLDTVATTAFTFANATTLAFTTAPANGVAIRIFRDTDINTLNATFFPGSAIKAEDLNNNFTQSHFAVQEADFDVVTANTTAGTAVTTANSAVTTANSAVTTANSADTKADTAVATANTSNTNSTAAVATANTASTNATNAVNTANTASTNATTALNTANAATTTANAATTTANTASTNASAAVTTANTANTTAASAVSTANSAVSTANTANTTAGNAVTTANSASTTANTANTSASAAVNTANAASAAVSNAVLFTLIANVASIPGSPSNNDYIEIGNSTGVESFSPLSGLPSGFVGASGLTVRLRYDTSATSWVFMNYFANDSETRYVAIGNPNPTYYANQAAFPSATTYHGGIAHSHADGAMYYAHGGNWVELAKDSDVTTKLPLAGGTLTGDLTLSGNPTAANHAANKTYVDTEVAGIVSSAPATLDTLNELAAALGDDANFSTTVTNSIATKLPLAGGTCTGNVLVQANSGEFTKIEPAGVIKLESNNAGMSAAGALQVKFGGTSKANIAYDGSATFAGELTVNDIVNTYRATSTGTAALFKINSNVGGTNQRQVTIRANGDATFAGSMTVTGTGQYTGAQRGGVTTLTDAGAIYPNFAAANNFTLTIAGNRTIHNPTNQTAGQHGVIRINQDGTGGRVPAFASNWKFPGGTAPTFSTAANAQDLLAYYVAASGTIYAQLIVDLK